MHIRISETGARPGGRKADISWPEQIPTNRKIRYMIELDYGANQTVVLDVLIDRQLLLRDRLLHETINFVL